LPDGVMRRSIVSTENAVFTPSAKAKLFAETQAAAVDMETSIVKDWARTKGIDFVSVRAISDTADEAIDPRVMNLVDAYGHPRPTHVGSYLLGSPLRVRKLIKLGRNSKRAARNLGEAVRQIIEQLPPDGD
jgi:adenosylhomocysteine nucleosidase